VIRLQWAALFCAGLTLVLRATGVAQGETPQEAFTPPRVVAVVSSAGGPVDRVMLLFDHEVSRQTVQERLTTLGELCGSKVFDLKVRYRPFEALGPSGAGGKPVVQTFAYFGMEGLTDWKRGRLAVEPFARAFHDELPVRVKYDVGAEFPFREPARREFFVDGARVRHFPNPTSHQYDLSLASTTATSGAASPSGGSQVRRWTPLMTGLAIAIVLTLLLLIGLVAYGVRVQVFHGPGRPTGPDMEQLKKTCADPGSAQSPEESETQRG
jgi:hypothetical protein